MSRLHATNDAIVDSALEERRRRADRRQLQEPIRAVDLLLAELEELHLVGRKRVPEALDGRVAAVAAGLPAGLRLGEVRSRMTIVHLMDLLYVAQEELLHRKRGAWDDVEVPQAS